MPRTARTVPNHSLLTAALEGLELQRQRIDEQIKEVRSLLGRGTGRRGLGGEDLDRVGRIEPGVQRYQASVDLGPDAAVADLGVDGVGEVDRRGVGGEEAEFIGEGEVIHIIEILRAELLALFPLPLVHGHQRQRPKVSLAGALEVEIVVNLFDARFGRVAVLEFDLPEPGFDDAAGGKLLNLAHYSFL